MRQPALRVGWFEAITENFINSEGAPLFVLEQIRSRFPVALHGVALSIGSADGLNKKHLERIRRLADRIQPFQISDHLCFSRYGTQQHHELLPLPRTRAMLARLLRNIEVAQNYLKRPLVLENISAYREYPQNEIPEPEFLNTLAEKSGCRLLLDINNIYVNAANFRFNARRYLRAINPGYVAQYHLAGYTDLGTHLFDTHAEPVHAPVQRLFREARFHLGEKPFSLERDDRIPAFETMQRETLRLAAAKPVKMPARFDIVTSTPKSDAAAKSSRGLQREASWQRHFYGGKTLKAEPRCGTLSPAAAQKVYRVAQFIRLGTAIREKFSLLAAALGERKMLALQRSFIAANKSTNEDLALYAHNLPEWLVRQRAYPAHLADLARLDRLQFDIFHTRAEAPATDVFARAVMLSATTGLWSGTHQTVKVSRSRAQVLHKPLAGPQFLLCYREKFAVKSASLTAGQYRFVCHLQKRVQLTQLLSRAESENWLPPREVRGLFRVLGVPGLLT
jgi:uncharacterized protein (UPF0276 family)